MINDKSLANTINITVKMTVDVHNSAGSSLKTNAGTSSHVCYLLFI
jgi:hypothetical protein